MTIRITRATPPPRTDNLSLAQRRRAMQAVRSVDTGPEWTVRRLVHSMGYRYRLHAKDLPGKPDLVFPGRKKAIFVHGCFWHGHSCPHGARQPMTNVEYWTTKIEKNRARDRRNRRALSALGWRSLVVWECRTKNVQSLRNRLKSFLDA